MVDKIFYCLLYLLISGCSYNTSNQLTLNIRNENIKLKTYDEYYKNNDTIFFSDGYQINDTIQFDLINPNPNTAIINIPTYGFTYYDYYWNFYQKYHFKRNELVLIFYNDLDSIVFNHHSFLNFDGNFEYDHKSEEMKSKLKYEKYLKDNKIKYNEKDLEKGYFDFSSLLTLDPNSKLRVSIPLVLPYNYYAHGGGGYVRLYHDKKVSKIQLCLYNNPERYINNVKFKSKRSKEKAFFKGCACSQKILVNLIEHQEE